MCVEGIHEMELEWDTIERILALSLDDRTKVVYRLLEIKELHADVRNALQILLSNIIITDYLDATHPPPVKEKKPKAPRKKKVIVDVPVVQGGLVDAPVV